MLPHRYHPPLRNNAWERLAAEIAAEVFPGVDMVQDYDQLLDKRPGKGDARVAMHQDMALLAAGVPFHGQRHAHRYLNAGH